MPQVKLIRSISMIILWRDQKMCWLKKWLLLKTEWQQWIWLANSQLHIMQNWHRRQELNLWKCWCAVDWYFPQAIAFTHCSYLKAFLELLFSTLNVPKCALMNRSTQILPFGWIHSGVKDMKAWRASRSHGSPAKMKGGHYRTTVCLSQHSHYIVADTEHRGGIWNVKD